MAVDSTLVRTVPKAPTPLQVSMGRGRYGLRFFVVSEFNRTDSGVSEPVVSIRLQTQLEGSAEMLLDTGSARLLLGDGEYSSKECVKVLYDKLDAGEIEGLIVRGNSTWLGLSADGWREGEVRKMVVYGRQVDVCCLVMGRGKDRRKGFLIGAGKYGSFDNYRDRWRVTSETSNSSYQLSGSRTSTASYSSSCSHSSSSESSGQHARLVLRRDYQQS